MGEDGLIVSCYDHGGAGGGYENTWATGKLHLHSMKVRNIRIHNRPAYNSEVHGSRDMGVGELNNGYEDAELADTIMVVGANPLETQTNDFFNHWVPNLRGTSLELKRRELPNEAHAPGRIIIVDPRRTSTVSACEAEAGKEGVRHLAINSGTDLALFNALFTEIVERGWVDRAFIAASTTGFDEAVRANRMSIEEAARITGLKPEHIRKAAAWIAEPKQGGARRRTMFASEKGLILGNDNSRTNQALVNIALATGNIGRPGGGCVRLGGHQEGYSRPSDAHVGRPAASVDQLLIRGQGGIHHVWGCDHFKTTLNAAEFKRVYKRRTDIVKEARTRVLAGDRKALVDEIMRAIRQGGLFSVDVDIVPSQIGACRYVVLPAATSCEMTLTSMNGERRMRLTERYMDPPGEALPDCLIVAKLAQALERTWRAAGRPDIADRFKGYDWKTEEDAFNDGYRKHAKGGEFVTYERLRAMGTNGFQEPAVGYEGGGGQGGRGTLPAGAAAPQGRIVGTKRLSADGKFGRPAARPYSRKRSGADCRRQARKRRRTAIHCWSTNGRSNQVWQSAFLDQANPFLRDRFPLPFIEMNPADMAELGVIQGDLVEVFNEHGSTQAVAWPLDTAKRKETFMLFGFPTGQQGNVVGPGVNELRMPNSKQTWANIRKLADAPEAVRHITFKSPHCTPPA